MENKLKKIDIKKPIVIPKKALSKLSEKFKEVENKNDQSFKETIKSLKHIFKTKGYVKPKNWREIFYDWYYENYPDILAITHWEDLHTLIGDRSIILEWAEEYTNRLSFYQNEGNQKNENVEPFSVRFELLELLFDEKKEFRSLGEKQKEQIYKYILGISGKNGIRTARGIKNKDSKYRNQNHKERAEQLLNKIKKGIIL